MTSLIDTPKKEIKRKIVRGEPITVCGMTFYPITMERYDDFLRCKDAIALRQSSFPVKYLSKNYLSAVFAMEIDAIEESGKGTGIIAKIIDFLCLSLRIGEERREWLDQCLVYSKETKELKELRLPSNGEMISLSPRDFSQKIRPIIAEQNGIELPKEMQNLDLVRSNEWLKSQKQGNVKLNVNSNDLISSVAYASGAREKDLYDWTVLEFENRRRAINRDKLYTLFKSAELSGMVTFKNGNPVPSWEYDVIDDTLGTVELSEVGKRMGGIKERVNPQ